MRKNSKDSTTTVKVVCAILFITFVFSYVYSFQDGLLGMIQHAWSGGKTHYDRMIGALVISCVAAFVAGVTCVFVTLPQRLYALNYFPALVLLGLLTAVTVSGQVVATSSTWLIAAPLMFIAWIVTVKAAKGFQPFLVPLRSTSILSQPWWTNASILIMEMVLVFTMSNNDRTLHTRLDVERLCKVRQWDDALSVGFPQYDNDSSLTMLRAMALANKGELGESLFTYELTGQSDALLPKNDKSVAFLLGSSYRLWQTIGFVPRNLDESVYRIMSREIRRGTAKPAAKDYLLCASLMDRDLKRFVELLQKYYPIDDKLPQHYKEALILYRGKYRKEVEMTPVEGEEPKVFRSTAMEADYQDFMTVMRNEHNTVRRHSALRDAYFGTYWYYYFNK